MRALLDATRALLPFFLAWLLSLTVTYVLVLTWYGLEGFFRPKVLLSPEPWGPIRKMRAFTVEAPERERGRRMEVLTIDQAKALLPKSSGTANEARQALIADMDAAGTTVASFTRKELEGYGFLAPSGENRNTAGIRGSKNDRIKEVRLAADSKTVVIYLRELDAE